MGDASEYFLPLQEGLGVLLDAASECIIGAWSRGVLAVLSVAPTSVIRRGGLSIEAWALAVWVCAEILAHVLAIHSKAGSLHLHEEGSGIRLDTASECIIGARSRGVLAVLNVAPTSVIRRGWLSIEPWALAVWVCTETLAHVLAISASNLALQECAHAKVLIYAGHGGVSSKDAIT